MKHRCETWVDITPRKCPWCQNDKFWENTCKFCGKEYFKGIELNETR